FGIPAAEFTPRTVPGPVFRKFQVIQKRGDISPGNGGRFDQWPRRVRNAIYATMGMVAQWVTLVVLHVANQYVVPINDIQRAVGREFHVNGPEVRVVRLHQVLSMVTAIARSILHHSMLFRT